MTLPTLAEEQHAILEVICDLTRTGGEWPVFKVVDVRLDRRLGLSDSQSALAAVPSTYLVHPRVTWGYNEADQVRLTLRGIGTCTGGQRDLDLLLELIKWAAQREQDPTLADEADLALRSMEFADHLGLALDGNEEAVRATHASLRRVHFLASSLSTFYGWVGSGDQSWDWHYNVVRRAVRVYRNVVTVADLLDLVEPINRQPPDTTPTVTPQAHGASASPSFELKPGEATDVKESTVVEKKVFISHASADSGLADLLHRALLVGGVPHNRIFYSSDRLTGIPAGRNVAELLRQSLREAGLIVELLTPTFLERSMCLIELGGAWVSGTPTFPIVVPPLTTQVAREAIGDVHLLLLSLTASNRDLFSELQDRLREDLGLELSARRWGVALRDFDKDLPSTVRPSQDDPGDGPSSASPGKPNSEIADDDDEFVFSGVVVRDGNMYGEATNSDSRPRSAILTVTFYNEKGEIVGTDHAAINDVRPRRSRTFTLYNVPRHEQYKIEVATLI